MTIDHPFASFGLSDGVLAALTRKGFTAPSPIQTIALPRLLADEGHLIVKARTGTGKTAAFGIPLVERLTGGGQAPRALVLTPTRELALQVSREIASFVSGAFPRITAVYGGASIRNQIIDLKRGTEVVVGTPGRIMDLLDRRVLDLSAVDWFILDEADEMLDMGFLEDVEKILSSVKKDRRVALFSATMPEPILRIVREHIGAADILEDAAAEDEKPAVDQFYMVLKREDRLEALRRIVDSAGNFYGLVFCATKAGVDELARRLTEGGYSAEAIHGDLTQEARERTLRRFRARQAARNGEISILVATDVAARGLDIERLTHVINWDLPNDRETYLHRIGRTGRAGRRGAAISLALPSERGRVVQFSRSMERTLGSHILWMKVPSVKSVMKAQAERILVSILEMIETIAGPEAPAPETAAGPVPGDSAAVEEGAAAGEAQVSRETRETLAVPPALTRLGRQLIERLGPEGAVDALILNAYGELLDPARYGPVTELGEFSKHEGEGREKRPGRHGTYGAARHGFHGDERGGRVSRVYVGIGRRHGASPRDVAGLLMRAGGVPGKLIDSIEMKDYCAFATLPEDAAKRAYAFSRKTPGDPTIKPASPP
jgi:ATP-dependent RNA helicase DeaD